MGLLAFQIVSLYTGIATTLSLLACMLVFLLHNFQRNARQHSAVNLLKSAYVLLALCFALPVALGLAPASKVSRPSAQTFSGTSIAIKPDQGSATLIQEESVKLPDVSLSSIWSERIALSVVLLGFLSLFWASMQLILLRRWLSRGIVLRRIHKVCILVSEEVAVPCATRGWKHSYIVLPVQYFENPAYLRMSVRHEAEHLRNGDPVVAFFLSFLRVLFLWNPLLKLLQRSVHTLQEFACDEHVVGHRRCSAQAQIIVSSS